MTVAYVTMPGTSGNYASSADTNLLNADTAHLHQSVGAWIAGADTTAFIHDTGGTPAPPYGSGTAKATTDGTGPLIASLTTPTLAAVEHTFSVDVWSATAGREGFVTFDGTAGTVVALSAGWTRLSATKTVTAGTKAVTVSYRQLDDSAPAAAEDVWLARACIRTGTSAVFVPSYRIVGAADIRWDIAATDYSPASEEVIIATWDGGNNGFAVSYGAGGVYSRWGTGSVLRENYTTLSGVTDGARNSFRLTLPVDGSDKQLYLNGVAHSTNTSVAGAASPSTQLVTVARFAQYDGGHFLGDIYYVEVRDGIDGPVVRRFDADDLIGLV